MAAFKTIWTLEYYNSDDGLETLAYFSSKENAEEYLEILKKEDADIYDEDTEFRIDWHYVDRGYFE